MQSISYDAVVRMHEAAQCTSPPTFRGGLGYFHFVEGPRGRRRAVTKRPNGSTNPSAGVLGRKPVLQTIKNLGAPAALGC